MDGSILTLNAGSSSLKIAVFDGATLTATARGSIDDIGEAPKIILHNSSGALVAERQWNDGVVPDYPELVSALLELLEIHGGAGRLAAIGHRVVHGGADHVSPARITPALLRELDALTNLDPLHMPGCLAPIRAILAARPTLAQVVCFDTAFHQTMPAAARNFGIPRALTAAGVRRYGFHGLSYEYIARTLAPAPGRVIVAHLGSGASLCALRDGRSIATTMGFSPLDGLVMGTRCGTLDPGVILHLARKGHLFPEIEDILYRRSGLLGVSGISGDIRELLASEDAHAADAVELFVYRIVTEIGGFVSALGGLDLLVFTAGIGAHMPAIRRMVCGGLGWLGLRVDQGANASGAACIGAADSAVAVRVIPTDEEAVIARHTRSVLGGNSTAAAE